MIQFQCFFQYKACLGHDTFKGIYYQDDSVYHFQHTLYFAAEICMPRSVDDIDLCAFIHNGSIFGQNGNTPFSFDIIGVHDTFCHFLIFPEYSALFQKLVHKGGLAMVYMGNDCYVSNIISCLFHIFSPLF